MDDIIVYGESFDECLVHLETVVETKTCIQNLRQSYPRIMNYSPATST